MSNSQDSRLTGASEFKRVYTTGRVSRRGYAVVFVADGVGRSSRVGVVASGKIGGAVVRNRAKRRLRSALGQISIPSGMDVIVGARRGAIKDNFQEMVDTLREILVVKSDVGSR